MTDEDLVNVSIAVPTILGGAAMISSGVLFLYCMKQKLFRPTVTVDEGQTQQVARSRAYVTEETTLLQNAQSTVDLPRL